MPSSRSTIARASGNDFMSSGCSSVSASSARPQRSRISNSKVPMAVIRPSRAIGDGHDFSASGSRRRMTSGVAGSSSDGDHFAGRARAECGERVTDAAHHVVSRQQLDQGADDERIAWRVAQRGANPQRRLRNGIRRSRRPPDRRVARPAEPDRGDPTACRTARRSRPAMLVATVKSAIEYSIACSRWSS